MPTAEVTRLGSKRMTVRIDVTAPDDPRGASVVANARLVGVDGLTKCRVTRVHHIDGALRAEELDRLCREVLIDPVVDEAVIDGVTPAQGRVVEVALMPGATDPNAANLNERRPISDYRRSGWSRSPLRPHRRPVRHRRRHPHPSAARKRHHRDLDRG